MVFRNPELAALVPRGGYRREDLARVESALDAHGTLSFVRLPSGLFPASSAGSSSAGSGYDNVWVRDNVYVAFAHFVSGDAPVATGVARALITFFHRHGHRFDAIVSGAADPDDVAQRPHVRFDGRTLTEIAGERWAHAQNDALGYVLWLIAALAAAGRLDPEPEAVSTVDRLLRYLSRIRFWEDEDSGHWEEGRKLSASSIGTVVAGLEALSALAGARGDAAWIRALGPGPVARAIELASRGRQALAAILPHECAQLAPGKNRRYDAALLFLLYPLGVIGETAMTGLILHDVDRFLGGAHGIRRYLGDSYWAPDYETHLAAAERTRDFSDDIATRDALLARIGDEAQWCLFDPILSAWYGRRFQQTGAPSDLEAQTRHVNRSLAQITTGWRCAELHYLRNGEYVANPHVPLQWTQANLVLALRELRASVALGGR